MASWGSPGTEHSNFFNQYHLKTHFLLWRVRILESHVLHQYYTLKTEVCPPHQSYLLCCNKKQISSFILYANSSWHLPACRFVESDLAVRRWILSTYLSQEIVAQQEVLLSQKEWVVMVAQQWSYCKGMFMAASAAKTPSGQSLSNNVSWAATAHSAGTLERGQTPRIFHCLQFFPCSPFGHSPRQVQQWRPARSHTPPCVGQPYCKGVWATDPTVLCVHHPGTLRHDLSKGIENVELAWESFSFTWILFGFG